MTTTRPHPSVAPQGNTATIDNGELVVAALQAALALHDPPTARHSQRVARHAELFAEHLGLDHHDRSTLRAAATLHDLGKLAVPAGILHQPGPLDPDEWDHIQAHPALGADMLLAASPHHHHAADAIRAHHERWDGTGYPNHTRGDNIPLPARIIALADVYDALTSPRPYRPQRHTHPQALHLINQASGTHFDPHLTAAFTHLARQRA